MPVRLSSLLGVTTAQFETTGAFDPFVDIDAQMHVDPHLLSACAAPEMAASRAAFERHFDNVRRLLVGSRQPDDLLWNAAVDLIVSKEVAGTGLGFSAQGTNGSGIGLGLARELASVAKAIIDAGTNDIELFELLGLFQKNVGADRISDMTISAILPDLCLFSQRVASHLGGHTASRVIEDQQFTLPATATGESWILFPRDILRTLPVAKSWSDLDRVASHNEALRRRANRIIGTTWKKATRSVPKMKLLQAVLTIDGLMTDLIALYRNKPKDGYDFARDPEVVLAWHSLTERIANHDPLPERPAAPLDGEGLRAFVMSICMKFKAQVEDNRLYQLLYNDDRSPRNEKIAQRAFFGIASAYCDANDLDLSPESNGGSGPVDFKISRGKTFKITVEMKLSSNSSLAHGYEKQLPTYARSEGAHVGIYLIVINGNHAARLKKFDEFRRAVPSQTRDAFSVVIIDGRPRPSASHTSRRA